MIRIKNILAAAAITAILLPSVSAYASIADMVNQQLEENDETNETTPQEGEVQSTPVPEPSAAQTPVQEANFAETVDNGTPNGSYEDVQAVVDAINALDPSNPDEYLINVIRASYDALPMSLQIQVLNIDVLIEAEANLQTLKDGGEVPAARQTFREAEVYGGNPHAETGESPYSGTEYTFNVKKDEHEKGITIFVRFSEDINGDGTGDTPSLAIMYPDAAEEMAVMGSASLSRGAALTWAPEYLQIDIASPDMGLWTISSSLKCVFETRSYSGIPETFVSEEEKAAATVTPRASGEFIPVPAGSTSGGPDIKAILLLAVVGAAIVAALVIFIRALLPHKPKAQKEEKKNKGYGGKGKRKAAEDENNEAEEAAKQEELKRILADENRMKKQYAADDAAYAASLEKQKAEKEAEQQKEEDLDITIEDIDNDDAIEEYTDGFDTGILSKNWNDDGTTGDTGTLNSRFGR